MHVAVTGATGFIGRYLVRELVAAGHSVRCWYRPTSDRSGFESVEDRIDWVEGQLGSRDDAERLLEGCEGIVHAALYHPGGGFRGGEGDLLDFAQVNILGTLALIQAAQEAALQRFVFVSTCAVHEKILDDRPLDEAHPLWATSHYGAHKAALEKFVHSFGLGSGFPICAVRPTGVYGASHPVENSKWFDLVSAVVRGETVTCRKGGKEVHAADVARACTLLLNAPADKITGEAFNCYDRYLSHWDVAHLARDLCGGSGSIKGQQTEPKNQIVTEKIRSLGMEFGGQARFEETIRELVKAAQQ